MATKRYHLSDEEEEEEQEELKQQVACLQDVWQCPWTINISITAGLTLQLLPCPLAPAKLQCLTSC
jgi:hypothetical protein